MIVVGIIIAFVVVAVAVAVVVFPAVIVTVDVVPRPFYYSRLGDGVANVSIIVAATTTTTTTTTTVSKCQSLLRQDSIGVEDGRRSGR